MEAEKVYSETVAVFVVLMNSSCLDSYVSFDEKRIALDHITSDFFFVCEVLYDKQEVVGKQRYAFQHRAMSHAIIAEMTKAETLSWDALSKVRILEKYSEDIAFSIRD